MWRVPALFCSAGPSSLAFLAVFSLEHARGAASGQAKRQPHAKVDATAMKIWIIYSTIFLSFFFFFFFKYMCTEGVLQRVFTT